jgi:D-alanyl-D-alanine carboxypeptidase/D-alanyl-D-alanine-endopeptidase (penicillin-binding protein 4)
LNPPGHGLRIIKQGPATTSLATVFEEEIAQLTFRRTACLFPALWLLVCLPLASASAGILESLTRYPAAGLLYLDDSGVVIEKRRPQEPLVPASTTKLVTAYLALTHWGEQHRFRTDFFLDGSSPRPFLWIKGYGDPFLVSEELRIIARNIQQELTSRGIRQLQGILLDTSYFARDARLPGTGSSNNPYDAIPTALAANFNTVFTREQDGDIVSAESQTPLTPTARSIHARKQGGSERVNTGTDPLVAERYFGELIAEFLRGEGIAVGEAIDWRPVPAGLPLLYRHSNSRTLGDVIRPMLKYSTNFVANQLILKLAAELQGVPATPAKVANTLARQLGDEFGWTTFVLQDGAGLSRANRLSAAQLIDVLERFKGWRHLLPEIEPGIYAKSGTLAGVSALAGYIEIDTGWRPFAVIINHETPYRFRNQLAIELGKHNY